MTALEPSARAATAGWRGARWLMLVELALVVGIFVADKAGFIPFSETPFLLAVGWISLRVRRLGWRSVGLGGPAIRSWPRTIALGIAAGLAMEALELYVSQPLLIRVLGHPPDLSTFSAIRGNPRLLLAGLALIWTLAAFGEEMVWRGYLLNRVADLVGRTRGAWIASVVLVNVGFGLGHAYQGLTGVLDEGLMGVLLGACYLAAGRRLAVPIIAHGVQDTVDVILLFLGAYPL